VETTPLIWDDATPFTAFFRWSEWLHARTGRTDSIALVRLMELLFEFLTRERQLDPRRVAEILWRDYQRGGRHDKPSFLAEFLTEAKLLQPRGKSGVPKRQARHTEMNP
jgi:ribosomal protein S18